MNTANAGRLFFPKFLDITNAGGLSSRVLVYCQCRQTFSQDSLILPGQADYLSRFLEIASKGRFSFKTYGHCQCWQTFFKDSLILPGQADYLSRFLDIVNAGKLSSKWYLGCIIYFICYNIKNIQKLKYFWIDNKNL